MMLERTLVIGNSGTATGTSAVAQGGGIWNDNQPFGGTAPQLALTDSAVLGNRLSADPGITPEEVASSPRSR
jgi:hypothetical protein